MKYIFRNANGNPRFFSLLPFVLAGALLASGPAGADLLSTPDPMQGYYFGIGAVGTGSLVYSDETAWLSPFFGPGGSLHIGQGITDNLALGINAVTSFEINEDRTLLVGQFGIELKWRFYSGFFVRPAFGFGFSDPTRRKSGLEKITPGVAGSYSVELGFDYFAKTFKHKSGGLALTPLVFVNAKNGTGMTAFQWGIGFEITVWTGLPKNQLNLPMNEAYQAE